MVIMEKGKMCKIIFERRYHMKKMEAVK